MSVSSAVAGGRRDGKSGSRCRRLWRTENLALRRMFHWPTDVMG